MSNTLDNIIFTIPLINCVGLVNNCEFVSWRKFGMAKDLFQPGFPDYKKKTDSTLGLHHLCYSLAFKYMWL